MQKGKYIGRRARNIRSGTLCFICSCKLSVCMVLCQRNDGARGKAGIHNRERERERERLR